jgi:hypothetical protein
MFGNDLRMGDFIFFPISTFTGNYICWLWFCTCSEDLNNWCELKLVFYVIVLHLLLLGLPVVKWFTATFPDFPPNMCTVYNSSYKYMYIIHNMSIPQIGIHIHWKSLNYIIIYIYIFIYMYISYIIYIYYIYTCFGAECWSQLTLDLVGHSLCVVWSPPFWYVETHHFNI